MQTDEMSAMKHQGEAADESRLCSEDCSCGDSHNAATDSHSDDDHSVESFVGQADEDNAFKTHPAELAPRDDTSEVIDGHLIKTNKKRQVSRQVQRKSAKVKKQKCAAAQSEKPMGVATVKQRHAVTSAAASLSSTCGTHKTNNNSSFALCFCTRLAHC